jgi:hypothetical protein
MKEYKERKAESKQKYTEETREEE